MHRTHMGAQYPHMNMGIQYTWMQAEGHLLRVEDLRAMGKGVWGVCGGESGDAHSLLFKTWRASPAPAPYKTNACIRHPMY